jgi:hypothetical protein
VLAPMPSVRVEIAIRVKPGAWRGEAHREIGRLTYLILASPVKEITQVIPVVPSHWTATLTGGPFIQALDS